MVKCFIFVMSILKKPPHSKTHTDKYIAGLKCEFRLFSCSSGNLVIPPLRRNAMLRFQYPDGFKLTSCKKSQNIRTKVSESFLDPVINSVEPIYGKQLQWNPACREQNESCKLFKCKLVMLVIEPLPTGLKLAILPQCQRPSEWRCWDQACNWEV